MGNDQTTLQLKDSNRLNISKYVEISAEHNKKILYKNLKPVKEFTSIIKSIHVRSTYLKYDWAQWLCVQLQKSPSKLYEQYCEMFKMALIKKKDGFESFLVKNLDLKFLVGFENNTRKLQTTEFGEKDLQKMFDEVKCYFMVESWFSELPLNNYLKIHQTTLSSKQNQNSDKSTQFSKGQKCTVSKSHANEEKIYRTLLKLTEMHFEHKYNELSEDSISPQCQSPKKNPMKFFNSKELTLVKMISKQPSFKLRQRYIVDLIESIFKNEHPGPQDNIQLTYQETRKIFALTRVLGLKNSYCVLKILSELGQTGHFEKIEAVFNYIIKILNVQCSQAKERRSQSPEKRKAHSKTKLESIR